MSIALLKDPQKAHEIADDLEALFWALVFFGLHFVSHQDRNILLNNTAFGSTNERVYAGQIIGGDELGKAKLLSGRTLRDFPFQCRPFSRLITCLTRFMNRVLCMGGLDPDDMDESTRATYDKEKRQIADPDWWIDQFQGALTDQGWEEDDIVDDIFPPKSTNQTRKELDALACSQYDSSHVTGGRWAPLATTLGPTLDGDLDRSRGGRKRVPHDLLHVGVEFSESPRREVHLGASEAIDVDAQPISVLTRRPTTR